MSEVPLYCCDNINPSFLDNCHAHDQHNPIEPVASSHVAGCVAGKGKGVPGGGGATRVRAVAWRG